MTAIPVRCKAIAQSPFEQGGDFGRARANPRALLFELRAELEDARNRRRVCQERLAMYRKQIADGGDEAAAETKKGAVPWLVGAVASMVMALILTLSPGGACVKSGGGGFFLLLALLLAVRWAGEQAHIVKNRLRLQTRVAGYEQECEKLREQMSEWNLRIAELERAIESAEKYL